MYHLVSYTCKRVLVASYHVLLQNPDQERI